MMYAILCTDRGEENMGDRSEKTKVRHQMPNTTYSTCVRTCCVPTGYHPVEAMLSERKSHVLINPGPAGDSTCHHFLGSFPELGFAVGTPPKE